MLYGLSSAGYVEVKVVLFMYDTIHRHFRKLLPAFVEHCNNVKEKIGLMFISNEYNQLSLYKETKSFLTPFNNYIIEIVIFCSTLLVPLITMT